MLAKFWNSCGKPEAIDRGELLREVRHPSVFRIRVGDWRAAVWFDHTSAVLWLLRALALARYPNENTLYTEFGRFEARGQLLPSSEERIVARAEQHLTSIIVALLAATRDAYEDVGAWMTATTTRPNGKRVPVGRVCVLMDEEIVTHFVLLREEAVIRPDLTPPTEWREALFAGIFASDEAVEPAYGSLPPGTSRRPSEIPLVQYRAEDAPPGWLDHFDA